jgi:hypothetical protein
MKIAVPFFPMMAARYFHTRPGARTLGGVSRGSWKMGRTGRRQAERAGVTPRIARPF